MQRRVLGKTELSVSQLSLGTWGLSGESYGPVHEAEAERVLGRAVKMGINLIDTSPSYGHGKIESLIGALAADPLVVVTRLGINRKVEPPVQDFSSEYLAAALEESRQRLGSKHRLVVLLEHPSARSLSEGKPLAELQAWKSKGLIHAFGISTDDEKAGLLAIEQGAEVISLAHNIFQVKTLHRLRSAILLQKVGVLAHSTLAYGLLAGRWAPDKIFEWGDHRSERWPGDALRTRIRQLDAVRPLVRGDVVSLRSAALRFVLADDEVSSAILGPKNAAQLDQLIRESGEAPYFPPGALEALERRLLHFELER